MTTQTLDSNQVLSVSNEEFADKTKSAAPAPKPRVRKAKVPTMTAQTLRALKAHRSRLIDARKGTRGKVRAALQQRIDAYTSQIENAVIDEKSIARASVIALSAHRTRLVWRMRGTRGKARAEMKAKLAHYDERIAA